jgi:hypothetical protein
VILEKVSAMGWNFDIQIIDEYRKLGFVIILKKLSWVLYGGFVWLIIEGYSDPVLWFLALLLVVLLEVRLSKASLKIEARKQDLIEELRE